MSERFNNAAAGWDKGDMRQNIADAVFQTIANRIALNPSMKIMDFGAGTGLLSFKIAPMVGSVVGVDLSEKMLEQLEAKNSDELSVEALYHDILASSLGREFNGIVSSMALHHVADTAHLFREFYAHLKKGGFIAIADLEEEDGSFHTHGNEGVHHFGFNREALRKLLENIGFTSVRFHEAYRVVRESGTYPIFVLMANK